MTWPASDVNTTNADASTDSPATFRTDVLDLLTKFNLLRNHVSSFMQGLLASTTAGNALASLLVGPIYVGPSGLLTSSGTYTGYAVNSGSSTDFNATTGVYTAPVAGKYLVTGLVTLEKFSAGSGQFTVSLNAPSGQSVSVYGHSETTSTTWTESFPFSAVVNMSAGGTISMSLTYIPAGHQSRVTGLYIAQVR